MSKHVYVWNAQIELPAHGKYAGGQGGLQGETKAVAPMSEADLQRGIARDVAADKGCDADGITFISFTFTQLTSA